MSLNEYKLSKTQREDALRAIIDAKHDWKVPKQNLYPIPFSAESFYGKPLVQAEPVAQEQPAEEEYEVEHIVEKKVKNGKTFYLVKWRGYPIEEATWEPIHNLEHAPLKIKDFESQSQMYDPLGEAANLKKPTKPAEPELKNKLKSPEPTVLYKTPSLEAVFPSQPTLIMNPYMTENLAYRPMIETRGLELGGEVGNENKNKKVAEKKATSNPVNSGLPAQLNSNARSQSTAIKTRMEEEPVRKEGNIRQDDRKMNNSGNKGNMVVQKELVKPKEDKGTHPHEKIKNASPEEEDPVVKMRKINSDTRERNLMRSDGETYLTSPTSLGSSSETQRKPVLTDEEKAAKYQESMMFPMKDNFMQKIQENVYQPYHPMLHSSNLLHTEINHIHTAYQRIVHGVNPMNNHVQKEYPKAVAGMTGNRDPNLSVAKIMQNQKSNATPETDDHNADSPQRATTKLNKKEDGEFGSFNKGDVPLKVMGIRPMPEINDLEILIDWKARENGTKPYNSKVRRVDLLKHGHFMPLIEFYESKMRLETAPNFDPKLLTKY